MSRQREYDDHHMLFERVAWNRASEAHRQARLMGAYTLKRLPRVAHDRLHLTVKPIPVPTRAVAERLHDIGMEYRAHTDDVSRVERMIDEMAGYVQHDPSPERASGMMDVITSLNAQLGAVVLHQGMDLIE